MAKRSTVTIPVNELSSFDLPPVCLVTGETRNVSFRKVKFSWYPRWVVALIIINLLVAALVAIALTKRAQGELPFTEEGYLRWRRSIILRALATIGALLFFITAMVMVADPSALIAVPVLAFVGCAVASSRLRKNLVVCRQITKESITLEVPSPAASAALKLRLHGGAELVSLRPAAALA